jgi:hypothetical protein
MSGIILQHLPQPLRDGWGWQTIAQQVRAFAHCLGVLHKIRLWLLFHAGIGIRRKHPSLSLIARILQAANRFDRTIGAAERGVDQQIDPAFYPGFAQFTGESAGIGMGLLRPTIR